MRWWCALPLNQSSWFFNLIKSYVRARDYTAPHLPRDSSDLCYTYKNILILQQRLPYNVISTYINWIKPPFVVFLCVNAWRKTSRARLLLLLLLEEEEEDALFVALARVTSNYLYVFQRPPNTPSGAWNFLQHPSHTQITSLNIFIIFFLLRRRGI